MASFHTKTFSKHDDYMTPKSAWGSISHIIPKDKVIWEPFFGDGQSGEHLRELGCKEVIHENIDFYENDRGEVTVSNPPFSDTKRIILRLKALGKPFILILPQSKLNTGYMRESFNDTIDPLQIVIPRKRVQFIKMVGGVVQEKQENKCNFDCFWYCWKIGLPRDITYLEETPVKKVKKVKEINYSQSLKSLFREPK